MIYSNLGPPLTSLIFSTSIFQLLVRLYPWLSGELLLDSLIQLIWQTSLIMIVYSLGEIRHVGNASELDYFDETGGELIIWTGLIMILASLGTINMMIMEAPLF